MKEVAAGSIERAKKDKDLAIAVTGVEGDGKSNLSVEFGLTADPFFELERNMLFSPNVKEMRDKIYNLPPLSVVIADEAIKIMYKLNWTSRIQKYLNKLYAVCRNQNKISIFNIPRITDINEYFRNHRVRLWIHIVDPISNEKAEGHAVVMSRSWNPVTTDPWGLKVFEKKMEEQRKKKKDSEYELEDKINLFAQMPSFIDVLKFNWVPKKLWDEYEQLKSEVEFDEEELLEEETINTEIREWRERTLKCTRIFIKLGYSKQAICKLFDIHLNTLTSWLRKDEKQRQIKEFNRPQQSTQ